MKKTMEKKIKKFPAHEIAGGKKEIYIPHYNQSSQFGSYAKGLSSMGDIYSEIQRDSHAYAVIQKRKMAVVQRSFDIFSDSPKDQNDKEIEQAKNFLQEQLSRLNIYQLSYHLLDAIVRGYAVAEILWAQQGQYVVIDEIKVKNPQRFVFNEDHHLCLLTREHPKKGIVVPDKKFIVHRSGYSDVKNPFQGVAEKIFWPVYFKRQGIVFWTSFIEKFANPTAVATYPLDMPGKEQEKLLEAVCSIAHETGIILPQGAEIQFLEAMRNGGSQTYEDFCRYMDEQISEAVLGETLTTNVSSGASYAATSVHNQVRKNMADADAFMLLRTYQETLVRWILDFNFPNLSNLYLRYIQKENFLEDDLIKRVTWIEKLLHIGYEPANLQELMKVFPGQWKERQNYKS